MPATISVGRIAIAVSEYEGESKAGNPVYKNRTRQIGELMKTEYSDGGESLWIKLNADALNPTLATLALRTQAKKNKRAGKADGNEDQVLANVFVERKEERALAPTGPTAPTANSYVEDGFDADGIPF